MKVYIAEKPGVAHKIAAIAFDSGYKTVLNFRKTNRIIQGKGKSGNNSIF